MQRKQGLRFVFGPYPSGTLLPLSVFHRYWVIFLVVPWESGWFNDCDNAPWPGPYQSCKYLSCSEPFLSRGRGEQLIACYQLSAYFLGFMEFRFDKEIPIMSGHARRCLVFKQERGIFSLIKRASWKISELGICST